MVVAVAAESGRRFWYQRFDSPINTGIAIENGRLYFATASLKGEAFALDATRGRKLWSRRIGSTLLRPVIVADQVIFATEQGTLVSLSKQSGGEKWQRQLSGRPVIQPTLVGDRIVTATTADSIYTFDVKTGDVLQRGALPGRPSAAPLIVGDTIYLALLKPSLVAVDAQSLRVLFERKLDASALAAPQAIGNSVYVLTRNAEVFKLDSQGLQRIASLGSAASGSFNAVGSRLIAGLLDGRVVALDESGQQVWQYQAARSIVVPVTPVPDGLLVTLKNGGVLKLK
jgi:outer membrane protein assembly factor BamB